MLLRAVVKMVLKVLELRSTRITLTIAEQWGLSVEVAHQAGSATKAVLRRQRARAVLLGKDNVVEARLVTKNEGGSAVRSHGVVKRWT